MQTVTRISKQFVAWGIALRSKFTSDIFFRTTVYVVVLQTGLTLASIIAFSWVLSYNNDRVVAAVSQQLVAVSQIGSAAALSPALPRSIDAIQNQSIQLIFTGTVLLSILFGLLLAYATLRPARLSLQYQKLFIGNVAHELRTPLSVIKTVTEVELLDPSIQSSIRKAFSNILSELDRASSIIDNLLSLNRFLRPERMEMADVDLGAIVDRVVTHRRKLADEYDIEVVVKKEAYTIVRGNAAGLEQIVANLLNNALHYTPRKGAGRVTLTLAPDYKGAIRFVVADNGVGIDGKHLFHIFEPFYRVDLSRTRRVRHSGSGLGLAIVSEIVRVHHGRIMVQSTLGKGTTVTVSLPSGTPLDEEATSTVEKESASEVSVDFSR